MKMKNVLITGASAGIGKALAERFASRGSNLVLVARRLDLLEEIRSRIQANCSVQVLIFSADVCDEEALKEVFSQSSRKLGLIDTVIANAGFGVLGNVEDLNVENFRKQFDVNVFGVLNTLYAGLPSLKQTRGRICLIGSTNAYLTIPGGTAYCMSKHAVRSLAEGLYAELAPYGVSVTLINPGFVESEIRKVNNDGVLGPAGTQDPVPSWLTLPASVAARRIHRAVKLRRREKNVTAHGQIGIWLARFLPGLTALLLRSLVRVTSKHSAISSVTAQDRSS